MCILRRRTGDGHKDGHIEHFLNQANHEHLECAWTNMFWSCNDERTCGKYKDKCSHPSGSQTLFDPDHIVDPGVEDPEKFFSLFVMGQSPVDDLDETDKLRAEETLRIFQLHNALLKKSREDAVNPLRG